MVSLKVIVVAAAVIVNNVVIAIICYCNCCCCCCCSRNQLLIYANICWPMQPTIRHLHDTSIKNKTKIKPFIIRIQNKTKIN